MITKQEYLTRMADLQRRVSESGGGAFLVTGEESIYYLTGVSSRPFERPFFIVVRPNSPTTLLVPALEEAHLRAAPNVGEVRTYWDYPSRPDEGWPEQLLEVLGGVPRLGTEPSLPQEIARPLWGYPG